MKSITLILLLLAGSVFAAGTPQYNILHIHADDHRADGLHALGTKVLQTPNLDKLVETGTTFSHAYTMGSMSGAVCEPSRTQLFDLSKDPLELNNLAGRQDHAEKVAEMTVLLEKEMKDHADKHPLTVDNPKPAAWTPPSTKP